MRVKLECPVNFLEHNELDKILIGKGMTLCNEDPQVVIVNPGTSEFLDNNYFADYKNLTVVGTPSTGTNHIDVNALTDRGVCLSLIHI